MPTEWPEHAVPYYRNVRLNTLTFLYLAWQSERSTQFN